MLWELLKDRKYFIVFQMILIFMFGLILSMLKTSFFGIFLICGSFALLTFVSLILESIQKSTYYKGVFQTMESIDDLFMLGNMIKAPHFTEGIFLYKIVKRITKSMNDEIAKHKDLQEAYKDYIEQWIHEVKLPIACINLMCENNKNSVTESIEYETRRINKYVEQALYYARSTNVEKDYIVRQVDMKTLVRDVLKDHSKELIAKGAKININKVDGYVYSDKKWLDFILGQIVSNSIKYKRTDMSLKFTTKEYKTNIVLIIEDDGVGIASQDLSRVFDKGFTGENGRLFGSSTGIGLYLCKKLCEKLNHGLTIESEEGKGTKLMLVLPKDKSVLWE